MNRLLTITWFSIFSINIIVGQGNYENNWVSYYKPVDNKIFGIWPHIKRYSDIERLKELKYKWGYNHIFLAQNLGIVYYSKIIQSGFDSTRIMRQLKVDSYMDNVESIPQTWAYYIDEPADLGDNLNEWISNTNWIKNKYSDSKIIISGYKRDENLKEYVRTIADKTMFSSYVHWWNIPLTNLWVAWPENPDQRSDWADMKSLFGNKFDFTWIGAHMDYAEYDDLMGKAKNLNLLGIFLYQKEPHDTEVDDNNLNKLSEAAVKHGYLEKYYQQVRNYYENGILKFSQFVGPEYSSDIPTEFNHSELIFNDYTVTNNRVEDYFAESRIIVGSPFVFTVPNAKKSSLNSNNEIILKPGFHAENGSEFRAYIGQ